MNDLHIKNVLQSKMELINVNITGESLNYIYTTKLLYGEIHGSFSVFEQIQNISKTEEISMDKGGHCRINGISQFLYVLNPVPPPTAINTL